MTSCTATRTMRVEETEIYAFKDETTEDVLADELELAGDEADWIEAPRAPARVRRAARASPASRYEHVLVLAYQEPARWPWVLATAAVVATAALLAATGWILL